MFNSYASDPKQRQKYYDEEKDVYFFDRHRPSFPAILYFYQSCGAICRPLDVPMEIFVDEVMFYQLTDLLLEKTPEEIAEENKPPLCRSRERTTCVVSRETVWNTFEKPETSMLAKVINFISIFFILLSTINFCLETIPTFEEDNFELINCTNQDGAQGSYIHDYDDYDPRRYISFYFVDKLINNSKKFGFWIIETMCICFFTIEFILRYWSAPDRVAFIRHFMNLIDLAAIVPYYIDIGFNVYIMNQSDTDTGACPRTVVNSKIV